ncbi:MAG TPA: type III pantothenate kinase [Xanthomonadales bacterium]|nr:type III pantothenate kinase [Xanthomonadales bacterium]
MILLVDTGNTRLKWALASPHALGPVSALPLDDALPEALALAWRDARAAAVWIASVASAERTARIVESARRAFPDASIETPLSPRAALGVTNAYAEPERLGIDRFLALAAARARGDSPALTVSLGTALAIDALAREGVHLGGMIAPAPDAMRAAVLGATARVAWREVPLPHDFGTSTEAGLQAGTWHAAAALVERAAALLEARCGERPRVLVAGGGGHALSALLGIAHESTPALVLEGLALMARAGGDARVR